MNEFAYKFSGIDCLFHNIDINDLGSPVIFVCILLPTPTVRRLRMSSIYYEVETVFRGETFLERCEGKRLVKSHIKLLKEAYEVDLISRDITVFEIKATSNSTTTIDVTDDFVKRKDFA